MSKYNPVPAKSKQGKNRKRSTRPPAIGTWRNLYGKPGEPPREMFDRRGGAV